MISACCSSRKSKTMNDKKCRLLPTLFLIIYRRDFFRAVREKSCQQAHRSVSTDRLGTLSSVQGADLFAEFFRWKRKNFCWQKWGKLEKIFAVRKFLTGEFWWKPKEGSALELHAMAFLTFCTTRSVVKTLKRLSRDRGNLWGGMALPPPLLRHRAESLWKSDLLFCLVLYYILLKWSFYIVKFSFLYHWIAK